MSTLTTISDRVRDFGIRLQVTPADHNPYMLDSWPGARHWRCVLWCERRRMTVYFSQGPAHTKPPTAEDVLNALAMDTAGFENVRDFDDWCSEYGYDTDSRKAERQYRAVERQAANLKRLIDPLGATAWTNLLFHTESL